MQNMSSQKPNDECRGSPFWGSHIETEHSFFAPTLDQIFWRAMIPHMSLHGWVLAACLGIHWKRALGWLQYNLEVSIGYDSMDLTLKPTFFFKQWLFQFIFANCQLCWRSPFLGCSLAYHFPWHVLHCNSRSVILRTAFCGCSPAKWIFLILSSTVT